MRPIAVARLAVLAALAGCTQQPPLPAAPADLAAAVNARGANECNREVAAVLYARGVTATQLTGIRYTESVAIRGHGDSFINGQTAWVSLQGQPGVGVVHLDSDCSVRGVGTDGSFRYPR
jgi:predicted small lipoprotein YifL